MKWQNLRRSSNVEDRRGMGRPAAFAGGGLTIVGIIIMLLLGRDPGELLQSIQPGFTGDTEMVQPTPEENEMADMCSAILASTEDVGPVFSRIPASPTRNPGWSFLPVRLSLHAALHNRRAGHSIVPATAKYIST
jgi:hypothetical protein